MYGIGNISPSVNQTLTPSATLGAPGDMYIITDTRQRPRKDLSETKAFQRFDIRTLNAEELAKMQAEDPLLYEQIKADMSTSGNALTEPAPKTIIDKNFDFYATFKVEPTTAKDLTVITNNEDATKAIVEYLKDDYLTGYWWMHAPTLARVKSKIESRLDWHLPQSVGKNEFQKIATDVIEYLKKNTFIRDKANTLGKPTIKFEFEDNAALADFLHATKKAADFANFEDVTNTATSAKTNAPKSKIRNGILMPADDSRYLPESPAPYSLPPTNTPPQLPTSPTSTAKALPPYNPQKEKYLKAKAQYPDAIIIFYYLHVGVSLCDDATLVSKALNLPINNGLVPFTQINGGFDAVKKAAEKLQGLGYNVVVVDQHLKMLLSLTPTTPEVEPKPQTQTSKSPFEDLKESYERSLYWGSFDPEGRTRRDFEGYDAMYYRILPSIPEDKKDDFTSYFRKKISEIISLQSKAPNAAVTGGGGVSARKAARYNAANDRLMEAYGTFSDDIERYAKRFIKRAESRDTDAIVNKIKREIDQLVGIIKRKEPYSYPLLKSNLANRIITIAEKGNVEAIEQILAYLRPTGLYTDRHQIWRTLDAAKGIAERQKMFENYEASQPDNGKWHVEYDTDEDRVKIIFDNIPDEKTREWLKKNGFRWSPRNKAWQRQITEAARHAVERFRESGLGKPTIKLEFEDNGELMSLFDTDGISGLTVNDKPAAIFNCPESELDTQGFAPTYIRLADYSGLIDAADGAKTLKGYGFEKATLDELINACQNYRQVERLAAHLKDDDEMQSAFNVWHWLHTNVRYNYDTPGEEEIRTPARVWADRYSGVDCDCLAVFTACLLLNMGYAPKFEIVAFNNSPTFSHIYVNLDGMAIDRVLPVFLARPGNITKTQIMEIPVYSLSGIDGCNTLSGVYTSTLAKVQNGTATGEDLNNLRKTEVLLTLKGLDDDEYKLAKILMPYVVTIGDDGKYYFDNAKLAAVAQKVDAELALLKQQNASSEAMTQWLANVLDQLDGVSVAAQTPSDEDTIVVIINPKGCPCHVTGHFVSTDLQTLTPDSSAASTAAATASPSADSPLYATTPAPIATPPDAEPESGNTWLWIAGISAAFGIGAALASGSGKKKRR